MESLITRSSEIIKEFQKPLDFVCDPQRETAVTMKRKSFRPRKMYLAAFAALLSALAVGIATGYSAPATFDMTSRKSSRVKPNPDEVTWIGSIVALGAMLGGLLAGPVTDKIGRKDALLFSAVPFCTGWLLICYANTVIEIAIGRIFCGIGIGLMVVTVSVYCVEISTPEVRGILGSSVQGFLVIGNLLSNVFGSYLTWDYLALTGAVFSTFAMICFIPMPESPRWFLAKGKLNSAVQVMNELQEGHVNAEMECRQIYQDLQSQPKGRLSFKECLHPAVYKPALICIAIMFFQQFSGSSAIFFYSSLMFETTKDFMNPNKATIILGVVQVVATILSNVIVDKAGRKILLIISGVFMAFSLIFLGTYYYIGSTNGDFQVKYNWAPLASLVLFVSAYSTGYGPLPYLLSAEMIPVRARSTVSGLTLIAVGLFGFIITKTYSELEGSINKYGTFWFYSCFSVISVIFVIFVVPETKGKKLEEIEKLFYNKKQDENDINISVIS